MKSAQSQDDCPPVKRRKDDVDQMLESLLSMEPTAQIELWKRMIKMHSFSLTQLRDLHSLIDDRIRMDIISSVPYEIAAYIMSYLSPKDLCQAAQACRSWRIVCEDVRLWREKCEEEGLLNDKQTFDTLFQNFSHMDHKNHKLVSSAINKAKKWKPAYLRHMRIIRNWRTRAFTIDAPFITTPQAMQEQQAQEQPPVQLARRRRSQQQPAANGLEAQQPPPEEIQVRNIRQKTYGVHAVVKKEHPSPRNHHFMQLRCHEESVITCLQYNPLTNIIVSGSDDQTLKVWSSETGKCINTLEGHTGGVWSSQLSPEDIVISGATDRTVRVWQARTGKLVHTLYGHTSTVRCLALDGDKVVSGSRDSSLRLWDIHRGVCLNVFLGHGAAVRCVEYKDDIIVSGAYDHLVMVWDANAGTLKHTLECHFSRIYSLQFDGKTIASGSLDSTICIWDAKTGRLRHHLEGHQSLTSKMQLKDNLLVSANADSYCKIWDVNTGRCLQTLGGEGKHTSAITSVYFNNRHVVTSSDDGTVKLWDIRTGKFVRNLIVLPTASNGGVVWRIRASYTKLICAVGSRTQTEDTHLLVLDFKD